MVKHMSNAGRRENFLHFHALVVLIYHIIMHINCLVRFSQCSVVLLLLVRISITGGEPVAIRIRSQLKADQKCLPVGRILSWDTCICTCDVISHL